MNAALIVENVSLSFGGVQALDDVSIEFPKGQIIGIIGPNGAGKTTLLNVVCGIASPTNGEVYLDGLALRDKKPNNIATLGIRRTFQTSQLFPSMSVLENMMTGLHLSLIHI